MDVKQENFRLTSGFKAKYAQGGVFMFAPRDEHSHRFNPLDTVRRDSIKKISDISDIANILLPKLMEYILKTETVDLAVLGSFNNFLGKATKEQSGVKSHLTAKLKIWKEPNVDAATSTSDFRIEDFRRVKTALCVGFSLSDLDAMRPLLNLFCQLAIKVLVRHIPKDDEPHEILMLVDEFPALGKMESLVKSISVVREYKIRMMNVIQGLSQLDTLYKKEGRDFLMQNSALQVYYATNDETTTNFVSKKLGTTTIDTLTRNKSRNLKLDDLGSHAHSVAKREFLLPQEVQTFHKDKAIICKENTRPIEARKIKYYEKKVFKERLCDPVKIPKLVITPTTQSAIALAAQKALPKKKNDLKSKQVDVLRGLVSDIEESNAEA